MKYVYNTYLKGYKMKKYYFITYATKRLGKEFLDCMVIEEHPFSWLKNSKSETNFKRVLVGWQEISLEEYNMYNSEEVEETIDQIAASDAGPLELINQDPSEGLES
jgi:hypothetical protein